MKLNQNANYIWNYFIQKGLTQYGVAGLMGNLYAESGLGTNVVERLCLKRYAEQGINYTDETYAIAIHLGTISKSEFLHPMGKHYGYGLAQWTTESRKSGLYDYCFHENVPIDDVQAQCEYLYSELETSFKSTLNILKTAKDINTASDYVLLHFEQPRDAESQINTRRNYSNEIYQLLGKGESKMATVILGSARIDENGHASGGKAGDQTGNEVSTQVYYTHSKGWNVLRANSEVAREKIAQDMEWACANNNIGYDQGQNQTLYNIVKNLGYNCSLVTTPCETDCARLIRVCVLYAGINAPDFYTGNELGALLGTGQFTQIPFNNDPSVLRRGDILVTKTKGHTVVALTNGADIPNAQPKYTVGWHQDDKGWWYADTTYTYVKKSWKLINHHWYYFDANGYMLIGWQIIDGKMYYLQESIDNNCLGACWISDGSGAQSCWYVK